MPWKASTVSEVRTAFVARVQSGNRMAEACRLYGISRKTGYKWLARAAAPAGLADRSRRPHASPGRTPPAVDAAIVAARVAFGWGGRKLRAHLARHGVAVPSARGVTAVLARHGLTRPRSPAPGPCQRFERPAANDLWQCDFKGPVEVARRGVVRFTVRDDRSRYLLALEPGPDTAMATAWAVLWRLVGEVGLPAALLCDNAFGSAGRVGLSWFEARLVRLGVRCLHGRPYHPQTQGKVERLHGTLEAEAFPQCRRDAADLFAADLRRWRTEVYNVVRPHEALGDAAPASAWQPSGRRRPADLPAVEYASGAVLRKVMQKGEISYRGCEVLAGAGIAGEWVQVEEAGGEVAVRYGTHEIRRVPVDRLRRGAIV